MDSASMALLGIAALVFSFRTMLAYRRGQRVQAALHRHHQAASASQSWLEVVSERCLAGLKLMDPTLRIGLLIAIVVTATSLLPASARQALRLEGALGQSLAVTAKWAVILGVARSVKNLPVTTWFRHCQGAKGKES
eukprot:TRINITY_DN41779_c0_g1_i1.p2 TRINITY_DN41779_c0_g1~~TRINITY_DN41779_c0_g1_i1.p2  ORF type:complete len:137 (+),score=18.30 TRINITY_DN41779_c0_g1_i1:45-455(+)